MLPLACDYAAAQRLIGVVLTLCEAQQEGQQHVQEQHQRFVDCVVQLLLTAPGVVSSLPAVIKVRGKGVKHQQRRSQPEIKRISGKGSAVPAVPCVLLAPTNSWW